MTVTGKFRSPSGRLTQSTNRQSEFSSRSHESRTKKAQCKQALTQFFSPMKKWNCEKSACVGKSRFVFGANVQREKFVRGNIMLVIEHEMVWLLSATLMPD